MTKLQRTTFKSSRAAEYVEVPQLRTATGQGEEKFAAVVVKELVDNALDACEASGVAPDIGVETNKAGGEMGIVVSDNGSGIPPETVRDALDFRFV